MVALVTGAGQPIGAEIVLTLAKNGIHVVVHYNTSSKKAKDLAETLKKIGVSAWTIHADFANHAKSPDLVSRAAEIAKQPISILINNASIYPENSITTLTLDDLVKSIDINAYAPLLLMRSLARQAPKSGGVVVNILDNRLHGQDSLHAAYLLSKQMFASITKTCALEFAPRIRVTGIAPGLILPPKGKPPVHVKRLQNTIPLMRHGTPQDIANAVMFCISSTFLTGDIIYIDGGKHLLGPMGL